MGTNAVQLFVRSEPFGPTSNPLYTWYLLDLFSADPIKLNLSVASIEEPLKVASAFSRTFKIPNTAKNAEFFKTAFNINTEDFDPTRKIPAYINDSGETLITGSIRLNNIVRDLNKQAIAYEIGFFGDTSDLGSVIAGKYLRDLDLTMFNHNRNYAAITNSWSPSGLFGGAIRYPLIEWGYTYDNTPAPTIPTLSAYFAKSFTSTANPLQQNQFKPIISLKVLWDAVISPSQNTMLWSPYTPQTGISGYTYSSDSFMGATGNGAQIWSNLYIILNKEPSATLDANQFFSADVNSTSGFIANAGATTQLIAPLEQVDPGNNYNTTISKYKLPSNGDYVFQAENLKGIAYLNGLSTGYALYGRFRLKVTSPTGTVIYPASTALQDFLGNQVVPTATLNLQGGLAGSLVEIVIEFNPAQTSGNYRATSYRFLQGTFKCTYAPTFINMQQLMPDNIKITDFLKAIIDRFKLVFIPSTDNPKEFKIIPWIDWIRTGTARDWSAKLDTAKDFKLTPLWESQKRNNVYKDADDSDYLNLNYSLATKQTYGQLNLDSGNELLFGEVVRESLFAPTPLDSIPAATGGAWQKMLIPKISKITAGTTNKVEPIQSKLRLVFWNGLQPNTGTTSSAYQWYIKQDISGYFGQQSYPLVSQFQQWPPSTQSLNLSWKYTLPIFNTAYGPTSNPTALTSLTQYTAYWQGWYNTVYNKQSKLVEATFNLDYIDVKDIKFNDYFWVNDAWYLVDSIIDFVVGQTTSCKVKLYKIGADIGVSLPGGITILTQVSSCFGTTACAAYCCSGGVLGQQLIYTSTPGAMVVNASFVFSDPYGNIPANPGYYKVGGVVWRIGSGGGLISITTPSCSCSSGTSSFATKFSATSLESVACATPLVPPTDVTIYGKQSDTFEENIDYYQDAGFTVGASSGFYRYTDYAVDEGIVLNIFQGTFNYATNITLTSCPSPSEYFKFDLGYGATADCDACCFVDGTNSYYSIDAVLVPGSILYTDFGITPVDNGIYSNGTFTYNVIAAGTIHTSGDCSCSCNPLYDIDLEFTSELPGFAGYIYLEKSFNGIDWLPVGTLTFPDSTAPNVPVTDTLQVEEKAFTRATTSYDSPAGTLFLQYLLNAEIVIDIKQKLPLITPVRAQSPDYTQPDGFTRKWQVYIRAT